MTHPPSPLFIINITNFHFVVTTIFIHTKIFSLLSSKFRLMWPENVKISASNGGNGVSAAVFSVLGVNTINSEKEKNRYHPNFFRQNVTFTPATCFYQIRLYYLLYLCKWCGWEIRIRNLEFLHKMCDILYLFRASFGPAFTSHLRDLW